MSDSFRADRTGSTNIGAVTRRADRTSARRNKRRSRAYVAPLDVDRLLESLSEEFERGRLQRV